MLENPQLYVSRDTSTTQQGISAETRRRDDAIGNRISSARKDYGLIFLTRVGCEYCEVQRQYLHAFQDTSGWDIREYDVNERPDVAGSLSYNKQGIVPLTVLVKRDSKESFPVAVGIESIAQLKDNIYRVLRYVSGETTPEQFFNMEYQDGGGLDPKGEIRQ